MKKWKKHVRIPLSPQLQSPQIMPGTPSCPSTLWEVISKPEFHGQGHDIGNQFTWSTLCCYMICCVCCVVVSSVMLCHGVCMLHSAALPLVLSCHVMGMACFVLVMFAVIFVVAWAMMVPFKRGAASPPAPWPRDATTRIERGATQKSFPRNVVRHKFEYNPVRPIMN